MRFRTLPFSASIIALALMALGANKPAHGPTSPAAATILPSTNPAMFSLRGQVKSGGSLDLQTIDLTRVVVYMESDLALDAVPIPAEHPAVAQKNKTFVPKFIVVPKGTVVEFPNWDHIAHNVFSRSAAAPAFDLDRYPYGQSKSRQFDKVGVVQIFCNIHPFMRAIIFVTPNTFFTRADKDGHFQIDGLPPGHYQVTAWQERCTSLHQLVDVGPGVDQLIAFDLEEDHDSIISNDPPKRDSGYGTQRGLGVKLEQLNLPVVQDSHPALTTEPCPDCN